MAEYDHSRSASFAGSAKVKGNLHWVSGPSPAPVEVRLYDHLFMTDDPASSPNWEAELNPDSERVLTGCLVHDSLATSATLGARFQFERLGYFVLDQDSVGKSLVLNQTVSLKSAEASKAKG